MRETTGRRGWRRRGGLGGMDVATVRRLDALTCVFQPIWDLADGSVLGYEALGRVTGREYEGYGGVSGWALQVGVKAAPIRRRLLKLALKHGQARPPGTLLFVNVDWALAYEMRRWAMLRGLSLNRLVLEIAEQSEASPERWANLLAPLRRAGAAVALDDFGAGIEDLSRLVALRPEFVKLAGQITARVGDDPYADRILQSLVHQARFGGFRLIVEQVEDSRVLARLTASGVRYGQGFVFGLPSRAWPTRLKRPLRRAADETGFTRSARPFIRAAGLTATDLFVLRASHPVLETVVRAATEEFPAWVSVTPVASTIVRYSDYRTHLQQVRAHLERILRGDFDGSDDDAARRAAATHLALGVPLAWYVLAYRFIAQKLREHLEQQHRVELAQVVERVIGIDMALFVETYQDRVERDAASGLLNREAFFARAPMLIRQADAKLRLTLIRIPRLSTLRDPLASPEHAHALQRVGRALDAEAARRSPALAARVREADFVLLAREVAGDRHPWVSRLSHQLSQVRSDLAVHHASTLLDPGADTLVNTFVHLGDRLSAADTD
jgi:EAL domain-containing protein (putative c-di-GMP-specific phosphodiesterase class I)/GGDEF domain-containing protein